jgi:hypothetical protein
MKTLDKNWLTSGLIDFEYKQYLVLAYLQAVKQDFDRVMLYPYLSDLVFHYQNLMDIKANKQLIYSNFPKEISRTDFEKLNLQYRTLVEDDDLLKVLEEIIMFALPQFQKKLDEGKDIYEYIEENLEIQPIGITPLNYEMGYFFLNQKDQKEMQVFEYQMTIFESANEKFRGINITFLESVIKSISQTFENIKLEIIRKYQRIAYPATYLIYSKVSCPVNETLLPVAKRLLVKHISSGI